VLIRGPIAGTGAGTKPLIENGSRLREPGSTCAPHVDGGRFPDTLVVTTGSMFTVLWIGPRQLFECSIFRI